MTGQVVNFSLTVMTPHLLVEDAEKRPAGMSTMSSQEVKAVKAVMR